LAEERRLQVPGCAVHLQAPALKGPPLIGSGAAEPASITLDCVELEQRIGSLTPSSATRDRQVAHAA